MSDKVINVLAINETKLDDSIQNNEINIQGYDIIRRDRETNGRNGGITLYVRSSINFCLRTDLYLTHLKNICIEIQKPNSKAFIVMTWYRPLISMSTFSIILKRLLKESTPRIKNYTS